MWKQWTLLLLLLAVTPALFAQPPDGPPPRGEQMEKIRAARQAFLRERLQLTTKQADAFFPLFWEYERRVRDKRREAVGRYLRNRGKPADAPLTEADALRQLIDKRRLRRELLELHLEAEDKFLEVLPAAKVLQLEAAEKAFRERLWERTRQHRQRG